MRKILMSVVVVLFTSGAYAQVGVGVKAGVNFANQDFNASGISFEPDGRTGFHFGVFAEISASDNIAIQPELLYSTVGSEFNVLGTSVESNFSYLTIPVLVKFKFAEIVNIHAGPQIGLLSSAEFDDEDISDEIKSSDFSLAAGAGLDLPMGLKAGLRYVHGLSNVSDTDEDGEVSNRVFQIYVGYALF